MYASFKYILFQRKFTPYIFLDLSLFELISKPIQWNDRFILNIGQGRGWRSGWKTTSCWGQRQTYKSGVYKSRRHNRAAHPDSAVV